MGKGTKGFTLAELLVVISVISIVSLGAIVGAITLGERARNNRAHEDIETIIQAIEIARANSGLTLRELLIEGGMTPSDASCPECPCRNQTPATLANKNSTCWSRYEAAIDAINQAAGYTVLEDYPEDAWGSPYLLNPNEGEAWGPCQDTNNDGYACCSDNVAAPGPNRQTVAGYDTDDVVVNIPTFCFPSEGFHHPNQN